MDEIILVVLSNINRHLIGTIKSSLETTYSRAVEVRYKVSNLDSAYDPIRKQYISPRLLSRLKRMKRDSTDKILGIVDVDLYSPGYDFVYGEADVSSGVATLSVSRLISEKPSNQANVNLDVGLFEERAGREAIHELGHLFGLGHCQNPKCVMRTCTCLDEVDEAGKELCPSCDDKLKLDSVPTSLPI
jgi:archaemetzincin